MEDIQEMNIIRAKHIIIISFLTALLLISFAACRPVENPPANEAPVETEKEGELSMYIDDTKVSVSWLDNESVAKLKEMAQESPVVINMSRYGGFEQVGSIGTTLPSNDVQMTTSPGDIVLYSSNQLVVFYGSNSWAYTKLGHIENMSEEELTELLSNSDVTIKIVME